MNLKETLYTMGQKMAEAARVNLLLLLKSSGSLKIFKPNTPDAKNTK